MKIFISVSPNKQLNADAVNAIRAIDTVNILCSYQYREAMGNILPVQCGNFIADSGAFSAMNAGIVVNERYIDEYIEWIKSNKIRHFIEMDLDEVIGYDKTLQIRKKIERETGLQAIPCWHLGRGADGWKRMCDEYDYVSISLSRMTQTSKWLAKNDFRPLKFFIDEARKRHTKVHALGCNDLALLKKYKFYSADSSTHTGGARYGRVMVFKHGRIININQDRIKRVNYAKVNEQNIKTMVEVMDYAEKYL